MLRSLMILHEFQCARALHVLQLQGSPADYTICRRMRCSIKFKAFGKRLRWQEGFPLGVDSNIADGNMHY